MHACHSAALRVRSFPVLSCPQSHCQGSRHARLASSAPRSPRVAWLAGQARRACGLVALQTTEPKACRSGFLQAPGSMGRPARGPAPRRACGLVAPQTTEPKACRSGFLQPPGAPWVAWLAGRRRGAPAGWWRRANARAQGRTGLLQPPGLTGCPKLAGRACGLVAPLPTWKQTPATSRPRRRAASSRPSASPGSAPYLLP